MGTLWTHNQSWPTEQKGPADLPSSTGSTPEAQLMGIRPMRWNSTVNDPSLEGDGPSLGKGVGKGGIKAPSPHVQASTSPPPIALHDPILLMSDCTTAWKILVDSPDLWNVGAGHGNVMSPHMLRRNFSLR